MYVYTDDRRKMEGADSRQLGTFLTGAGSVLYLLSIICGFSRTGMLFSNVAFFAGILLILGVGRCKRLFFGEKHLVATVFIGIGVLLIMANKGFLGTICQSAGIFMLFGGFLPVLLSKLRRMPVIGQYMKFSLPGFVYKMKDDSEETLPL